METIEQGAPADGAFDPAAELWRDVLTRKKSHGYIQKI